LKKADLSRLGESLKKTAINFGLNTKTFYETRGIDPAINKPDFQLSLENILRESTNANFILSSNTSEFTYIDMKKNKKLVENFRGNLTTAVYKFDNGNNSADEDEIYLETITNFSGLNNIDRIGGLFFEENENNPIDINFVSYVIHRDKELAIKTAKYYGEIPENWIRSSGPGLRNNDDGSGLIPSYVSEVRFFAEGVLNGETVSEAL